MNLGCPALTWGDDTFEGRHKVKIDPSLCIGCTLCAQVCTVDCIKPLHAAPADAMSGPTASRKARAAKRSCLAAAAAGAREPMNVLIVGVGGQGVIMVSKVLAWLAQSRGFEVKQSEVHGMAKRGGTVFSHVRFGPQVWSPTIPKGEADILVALEWAEGLRWLPYLKPDTGIFICDTKRIVPPFACLNRRPGAPLRYSRETPAEVQAHVAEGYAIDATAHGRGTRQRTRRQRDAARRAVDRARLPGRGLGKGASPSSCRRRPSRSTSRRSASAAAGSTRRARGAPAGARRARRRSPRRRTRPTACAWKSRPHGARAATSA